MQILQENAGRVARSADRLRFMTAVGSVEFIDTDCIEGPAAACQKNKLLAYLPDHGLFVVSVSYYEGGDYRLVDERTGQVTRLDGFPWLSPDGKRFVTATGHDSYDFNLISVWVISSNGPEPEWHLVPTSEPPTEVSYCFQQWDGSARVKLQGAIWALEGLRGQEQDILLKEFDATLALGHGEWRVIAAE